MGPNLTRRLSIRIMKFTVASASCAEEPGRPLHSARCLYLLSGSVFKMSPRLGLSANILVALGTVIIRVLVTVQTGEMFLSAYEGPMQDGEKPQGFACQQIRFGPVALRPVLIKPRLTRARLRERRLSSAGNEITVLFKGGGLSGLQSSRYKAFLGKEANWRDVFFMYH
ncbi:hypothetical protein NDU88_001364 [Pleurodeles waltl]|uniref:Uncharacterized protein n=1 Tax=Pleurodeles waltl TaxID=8319 RepID=A0AAV7LYD9_PLEWA|nr:hypothetical protein NDU88_001364 [Pleurodeles waltl]